MAVRIPSGAAEEPCGSKERTTLRSFSHRRNGRGLRMNAPLTLPEVLDVHPEQLDAHLTHEARLVVVYMWGPDCPNCVIFKRQLPGLLNELSGAPVVLLKIDVSAYPQVARRDAVSGMPYFLLCKGGVRRGK